MIRNGGALDGVRILAPRTVALMTTNQIGTLKPTPGLGFGLGFETTDRYGANGLSSVGTFGWGGAYGSTYRVDPEAQADAGVHDSADSQPHRRRAEVPESRLPGVDGCTSRGVSLAAAPVNFQLQLRIPKESPPDNGAWALEVGVGSCDEGIMNRRDFARLAGTALSAGALSESLVEAQVAPGLPRPAQPRGHA